MTWRQEARNDAVTLQIEDVAEEEDGSYTVETSLKEGEEYVLLSDVESMIDAIESELGEGLDKIQEVKDKLY